MSDTSLLDSLRLIQTAAKALERMAEAELAALPSASLTKSFQSILNIAENLEDLGLEIAANLSRSMIDPLVEKVS